MNKEEIYKCVINPKCPKCNSDKLQLTQFISSHVDYVKESDYYINFGESGYEEVDGIYCRCRACDHKWKLKKFKHLYEIMELRDD